MKYSELVYERPDFEKAAADIADASARLKNAATKEEFFAVIKEVDEIRRKITHAVFFLGTGYYHDASDVKMAEEFQYVNSKEEAIDYVNQEIQFLRDEWNITEGAAVDELEGEKRRLIDKINA